MKIHNFDETKFGGADYIPSRDLERMTGGMAAVFAVMMIDPYQRFTLEDLADASGVPQSSVGSYLCYLRRDFGYEVPKEHIKNGLYEYWLGARGEPKGKPEEDPDKKFLKQLDPVLRAMFICLENGQTTKLQPGGPFHNKLKERYTK